MPTQATIGAAASLASAMFSRVDGSSDEEAMKDIVILYKRLLRRVEKVNSQLDLEAAALNGNENFSAQEKNPGMPPNRTPQL